ncbi:50S ribosomal protein L6 [Candidatus Kapabacteria bacterium]|nr:50S ribosomal protein L6 [Candidatus Kapabacteria bacterium]
MSRIGKAPITVPSGVKLKIDGNTVSAKGPKGELSYSLPNGISFEQDGDVLNVLRASEDKKTKSLHGLSRSMVNNIIEGCSNGFKILLNIEGVGFRAEMKGKRLLLNLGFSHPVVVIPPDGIEFNTPEQTKLEIIGANRQLVGEVAAKIRRLRKPEPYKGKGIKYDGEYIRRKAGKTSAK